MTDGPVSPDARQTDIQPRDEVVYKGVSIEGLDFLEGRGITSRAEIFSILDQLPEGYAETTQLGRIVFHPRKHFTVERNGKVSMVDEASIEPSDMVLRRGRGVNNWNSEIINGKRVPTDGKQTITIFSTEDWEGENPSDVAKYALAHELGHITWMAIEWGPRIWKYLKAKGKISDFPTTAYLTPLLDAWKKLPESTLPRFSEYKEHVKRERVREQQGVQYEEKDLLKVEDFAVAHEYYLYWKSLGTLDPDRNGIIDVVYEFMADSRKQTTS